MKPTDQQHEEAMQWRWGKQSEAAVAGSLERVVSGLVERKEKIAVEAATYRHALKEVKEWYDRDGSVGGCSLVMETVEKALAANAEVSDVCPPLASETKKPRTGTRSLH